MNRKTFSKTRQRGATLVEAVIAVGVLSVSIPLVFASLAESGNSGLSSEAETRSSWMIPVCMDEIRASRDGRPEYFSPTSVGETFPPVGEVWALGFSPEGAPVGKLSQSLYDKGAKEVDGKNIRYIALMSAEAPGATPGDTEMQKVRISIEYPAAAPLEKRNKIDFHTRIP